MLGKTHYGYSRWLTGMYREAADSGLMDGDRER